MRRSRTTATNSVSNSADRPHGSRAVVAREADGSIFEMQFGIFDHMDDAGVPIEVQFKNRLELLPEFERAGFHRYQLAEHHGTPLGYAPSPNVFLAAAAQHTRTLRLGALVNLLPLYNPLRLLEEIGMLDNLMSGRLDLGMGSGASPVELSLFGVESRDRAREMYIEAFQFITRGLVTDELTFEGKFYKADRVPIVVQPIQKPIPLWLGTNSPDTMAWAASVAAGVVSLGAVSLARTMRERYAVAWAELGQAASEMPPVGFVRHVVVAETDEEARGIARRAYPRWRYHMNYLWEKRGTRFSLGGIFPETYDELAKLGHSAVGSPATVKSILKEQLDEATSTYLGCQMSFGDMTHEETLRSIRLFGSEVMPSLAHSRRAGQPETVPEAAIG